MENPTQAEAIEALAELVTKHTTNNVPEINRLQNIVRATLTQSAARIAEIEARLVDAEIREQENEDCA